MSASEPLLSEYEHEAMDLTARLANLLAQDIVGFEETRAHDLNELVGHIHVVQKAIMGQAAARAYPDRYRLLGRTL